MFVFLCILTFVVFLLLVVVTAMRPQDAVFSSFELERRAKAGEHSAKEQLEVESIRADIESLIRIKVAFLLVATAFLLVVTFGWLLGSLISLVIVLEYGAISRLSFIRSMAARLYSQLEPTFLTFVPKATGFMRFVRSGTLSDTPPLGSRQELEYLIEQSTDVLSDDEKKLVVHALGFSDKYVRKVMTPAADIVSIKKSEFLGPLTLDELHKSGHDSLPVTAQDIHHIVGILHLQNLLALDNKRSVTAEKAMDPHVLYVRDDQRLDQVLAAMLRSHQHVFIVISKQRETVGLVTLSDITKALLGRKIVDEFDSHESARAVASYDPDKKPSDD